MRRKQSSTDGRGPVVERLREFIRFNYVTVFETAFGRTLDGPSDHWFMSPQQFIDQF